MIIFSSITDWKQRLPGFSIVPSVINRHFVGKILPKYRIFHLFIYVDQNGLTVSAFMPVVSLFTLILKLPQIWQWEPFQAGFCIFLINPFIFWEHLCFLAQIRYSWLIFSLPQPWSQSFPQGSLLPFGRKCWETEIWVLGVLTDTRCCYPRHSPWAEGGNMYVYTH